MQKREIEYLYSKTVSRVFSSPDNDEQDILAKYAGWGGIPEIFDENNQSWSTERAELVELLADADYTAARASTTTSFYTPVPVIRAIYSALERFGLPADARILEPSAGTGRFFGALPQPLHNASLYGVGLDGISARIAAKLYPTQLSSTADLRTRNSRIISLTLQSAMCRSAIISLPTRIMTSIIF